jgi:hypothetical protein
MAAPSLEYESNRTPRAVGWVKSRFSRWHAGVAVALWLAFSGLTLLILLGGPARATRPPKTVAATTAGVVLGPMTGAICRDFQGCCLRFSLMLMPYCLAGLAAGVVVQLAVPARGWFTRTVRVVAWALGLIVWFGGGIVSFGHALS